MTPETAVPTLADRRPDLRPDLLGGRALPDLSPEEFQRYRRHLILPEVGPAGQRRLKAARVLLRRRRRPRLARWRSTWPRPAWARSASSTSTWSTPRTSSARCCTAPRTSAGRSSSAAATVWAREPGRRGRSARASASRRERAATSSGARTSSSTAATTSRRATWSTTPACCSACRTSTARSSASTVRPPSSTRARGPCYRCLFPEPPPPGLVPVVRGGRRAGRPARDRRGAAGHRDDQARSPASGSR